jgi:methionyl-tRNA synthetase
VWRYYLFRVRPQESDSDFEWKDFEAKVNTELVGNFGNFVNRIVALNEKFFDGVKQKSGKGNLLESAKPLVEEYKTLVNKIHLREALLKANEISSLGNKYLQEHEPWIKVKTDKVAAGEVIAECIDLAKVLAVLYYPFTPAASEKVFEMLKEKDILKVGFAKCFDGVKDKTKIKSLGILFAKLDDKAVVELKKKFSNQ